MQQFVRSRVSKICLTCVLAFMLAVLVKDAGDETTWVGVFIRSVRSTPVQPVLTVPPQRFPQHNAYDTLVQAGEAFVDPHKIDRGGGTTAERRVLLAKNAKALALVNEFNKQTLVYPYGLPQKDVNRHALYTKRLSTLLRLQLVYGLENLEDPKGRSRKELEKRIGANMGFGLRLQSHAPVEVAYPGFLSQIFAYMLMWRSMAGITDVREAQKVIQLFERLFSHPVTCADSLQQQLMNTVAQRQPAIDRMPPSWKRNIEQNRLNVYVRYMQQEVANARLPYPEQQRLQKPPQVIAGWFTAQSRDEILSLPIAYAHCQARRDFLRVGAALYGYRCEHGTHPKRLAELVPTYLSSHPLDPFARNETYRYRRTGDTFQLYSLGQDGRDNGGRSIGLSRYLNKDWTFNADITGDLVVQVN